MNELYQAIIQKLAVITPIKLEITDETDAHKGHSGFKLGKQHLKLYIVSESFEGKSKLERHKIIYDILKQEMENNIHALKLKLKTKGEENVR